LIKILSSLSPRRSGNPFGKTSGEETPVRGKEERVGIYRLAKVRENLSLSYSKGSRIQSCLPGFECPKSPKELMCRESGETAARDNKRKGKQEKKEETLSNY